jgi:hypothetical protein
MLPRSVVLSDEAAGRFDEFARQTLGQVIAVPLTAQVSGNPFAGQHVLHRRVSQHTDEIARESWPSDRRHGIGER